MKTLSVILFSFLFAKVGNTQNLVATYDVQREVIGTPQGISLPPLTLTGYYFKKNNTIISYLTADYLKEYPDGYVEIKELNHIIELSKDSIQALYYVNLDSQIYRYRTPGFDISTGNRFFYFDADVRTWEITGSTELINGILCTHAIQYNRKRNITAEIWFSYEFTIMPVGMRNLLNVPGLIVKAKFHGTRETFTLREFSTSLEPKDEIFWPQEFNEGFMKEGDLRKVK